MKKSQSFPRQCWNTVLLALILLFVSQVVCGVIGGILYWDAFKSLLSH